MHTMHLLVELCVKHHLSIESIAIMQSFFVATPTTTLGQDGVRCNSRRWRRSIRSLSSKRKTLQVTCELLIVFAGRGMPTSGDTLGASSTAETIRSAARS